ncbi:adenosylcobyric acid synthase (glutamine-hydrolysing) [Butyrivibrio fibrisolvens DSM 3071]|uniref:Cobyric acid synthase n=1 Tax=Butyrivibrio fibrisolvens DSM 3071 TaxID=1121131 RepID=A0A1M6GM57_BUTFI|nr:cobyric acid synthase [Butyrivibrio fibrisolvens]SHJ10982.1 adenosylcobyric acid synthase (glutamine-hydrolysing) [Butyrivibrio fibrisolvens DSM 3071]
MSSSSKVIMVQGTMSNVGKSLLVGGLCRVFKQDGYRVAPFKSQNMALNSFVTEDGLELGRAQAMQAECAGVKPSVYMNPILLKPTNDIGSQVIVNGEVIGNMPARDYFKYKKKLIPDIMAAYNELQKQADIIVVEGAGSPAEINLKSDDIVNMGLAELIDAPVLLVGDIDRGGVFAQLLGTLQLLEPQERARVKGLIINKFRGDKSLLDSGIDMIEEMGHVPVIGTVPYTKLLIDDEDSLSERLDKDSFNDGYSIDIAVVRFPRISNFTDAAPFESIEGVNVRFITNPREVEKADLVILPGSKNTIADLRWMRESGMEAAVKKFATKGPVIGICGGFQMLGNTISDPDKVEEGGSIRGLSLLDTTTILKDKKNRSQCQGMLEEMDGIYESISHQKYVGYEIHMGETKNFQGESITYMQEGNVFGTYVHGVFDEGDLALRLIKRIASDKGIELEQTMDYQAFKEQEYDKLAQVIRDNLDMEFIYSII